MLDELKNHLRPYLPRNIKATLRSRRDSQFAHVHVFSKDPAVVYLSWGTGREALHRQMKGRPLTLLYLFAGWWLPEEIPPVGEEVRRVLKRYRGHRVVMLCNEEFTVDLFRAEGIEAIFCNHNAWVNETIFQPGGEPKQYDAVYNAAMSPYKRHLLAAQISSLALITYRYRNTYETGYEEEVRRALAHAAWLVDAHGDDDKASAVEVAGFYRQARTGLCLSEKEGAMFASIEYLLCGLPVVTTKNIGGRDVFFDPAYVEWVEDDPGAVAQGMKNLIARAPAPAVIRERTLEKMAVHRTRLREFLKDLVPHIEVPWPPGSHGPLNARHFSDLGRELRRR